MRRCAEPPITGDEIFKFHSIRFERVIWKHFYANFSDEFKILRGNITMRGRVKP